MGSTKKVALVTGATGIQGCAVNSHLSKPDSGWDEIYGVSRKPTDFENRAKRLSFDMCNKEDVKRELSSEKVSNVTHFFQIEFGGCQILWSALGGETITPYQEDDRRYFPPNFYNDEEDYVIERRKKGAKWTWSSLRPGCIIGYSLDFMNLLHNIAVYGTLCKELGYAFRFPGTPVAYKVLLECMNVDLLADCQIWLATYPEAQNNFYNISNGDMIRFQQLRKAGYEEHRLHTEEVFMHKLDTLAD